ncbi:hypothetical protein MW290_03160 [Aquincola tertiaricarbonis]|uniref:Uncharacterized protein n=1 Tax=Aquincola tertiaricarbonis TaxID=391953 RepID=A0ABY4S2F6_AQUTE|nr:hypothetical protein [Aquincola tertiaricarbonis]URI07636.1 hypothetical protein MW290_03160 [Aquincola tertiaricarbonis]
MSPYREALAWFSQEPYGGSSLGLAKLILSLSTSRHPFSLADCLASTSGPHRRLAMRIVHHYEENGVDDELHAAAEEACRHHPRLLALSHAMKEASRNLMAAWADDFANQARQQAGKPWTDD